MEKQPIKKRVTCLDIYNNIQAYDILLNEELGTGYFGTVMKAYSEANPYEPLAVKVIPFHGDSNYKASIQKQIDMIYDIGDHPNLVRVLPFKCRSDTKYYIFMEYCNQGTLQQQIKQKLIERDHFTQPQIFKTFYELLSGYKVLWQKNILHQDLKPQNILIKNDVCKITDFGFSIFYQGLKLGTKRQGTLEYMPLEKLTKFDYTASSKSDVYSLGVIFFKMITGRHPYILRAYEDDSDFITQLATSELRPPVYIRARMSPPMQHLFELVIKMVAKNDEERVDFKQIYDYIDQETDFLSFQRQQQKNGYQFVESEQVQVPEHLQAINSRFVEYSTAFAIPFSVMRTEDELFEEMFKIKSMEMEEKRKCEIRHKIENYLCSMRMLVYFFDRLSRRLSVERKRRQFEVLTSETEPPSLELEEKVIISLVFLSLKITKQTLNECPKSSSFSSELDAEQWTIYKKGRPNMFDLVTNDQKYLQEEKQQTIILEKEQSKTKQILTIIEQSKQSLLYFMQFSVKPHLFLLLEARKSWIGLVDKKALTTLNYILTAIDIIENFKEKQERWEELQGYFREVESREISRLWETVHNGMMERGVFGSFDEGDWVE